MIAKIKGGSDIGVKAHQSKKRIRVGKNKAKEESRPKWEDPEIAWLKEQCEFFNGPKTQLTDIKKPDATGWRRYHPELSEMPVNWPGHFDEHGLRTDHLTPKSESRAVNSIVSSVLNFAGWLSINYKGPRNRMGILDLGYKISIYSC